MVFLIYGAIGIITMLLLGSPIFGFQCWSESLLIGVLILISVYFLRYSYVYACCSCCGVCHFLFYLLLAVSFIIFGVLVVLGVIDYGDLAKKATESTAATNFSSTPIAVKSQHLHYTYVALAVLSIGAGLAINMFTFGVCTIAFYELSGIGQISESSEKRYEVTVVVEKPTTSEKSEKSEETTKDSETSDTNSEKTP